MAVVTMSEAEEQDAHALWRRSDDDIIQSSGPPDLPLELLKELGAKANTVGQWYDLIHEAYG
jgi:hypothetical protein